MLLHGVGWKEYVILRELLDGPGLRMTFLEGALELMSPSDEHELWKTNIARLVELYAHVRGIDLYGYGSTTFKKEAKERGAEPAVLSPNSLSEDEREQDASIETSAWTPRSDEGAVCHSRSPAPGSQASCVF